MVAMRNVNGTGKISNGSHLVDEHNEFLQEQLIENQQALFFARSVKEAKFLQSRITFLKQRVKATKAK